MGATSRGCFCRFVVLPLVLVLIAAAIVFFIKNKVHPTSPLVPSSPESDKYGAALSASLQFLQIQKAGKLVNNQIPWRGDSALNDGQEARLDLSKGLYDAGDHMKFGLPMAFTATILSWTILEYGDQLSKNGKAVPAIDGLRWITDYLVNAHSADNVLCIQVGDPKIDHSCWDRPESMTESRPLLFINKTSPASDVAGETAAALAAASLVFKPSDPTYSSSLLTHAQQLFEFADNYTGISSVTFPTLAQYYNSTDYRDELLWAASWLYHATGDLLFRWSHLDSRMELAPALSGWLISSRSLQQLHGHNSNDRYFLVGYGSSYPQRVHHRGASIPADQDPSCSDYTWLNTPNRNPNVAVGALVGGPFFNETYIDKRDNALQGEPTTTSNALLIGLLSGLVSSSTAVRR